MMLILRIRKAEVAMADGRLDDAYQQAVRDDVQDHRRGQRLIGRLAKAFEKRSAEHMAAGNPQGALADVERAQRLAGNQPRINALREEALEKLAARQLDERQRRQQLAAARQCLAVGELSLGAQLCEPLGDASPTVAGLMQHAELTRRKIAADLQRARQATDGKDWDQALRALADASRLQPENADVRELAGQVTQSAAAQARLHLEQGRLDLADALWRRLRQHTPDSLVVDELSRLLNMCRAACQATNSPRAAAAIENLKSLQQLLPRASWIVAAIRGFEQVQQGREALRAGPLGLLSGDANDAPHETLVGAPRVNGRPKSMPIYDAGGTLPRSFLIHVDGAGSYLVVRGGRAVVGPPSRTQPVNVPVLGKVGLPRVTVERVDEDYFLRTEQPVPVNGQPIVDGLLSAQDWVQLGERGGFKFSLPCAASTSAVLDFQGLRLAHGNTRRVILMDDALVLGPQSSAHVQVAQLERALVLHLRGGALYLRPMSRNGETDGALVELNRPQDLDGLTLVVAEVRAVA